MFDCLLIQHAWSNVVAEVLLCISPNSRCITKQINLSSLWFGLNAARVHNKHCYDA